MYASSTVRIPSMKRLDSGITAQEKKLASSRTVVSYESYGLSPAHKNAIILVDRHTCHIQIGRICCKWLTKCAYPMLHHHVDPTLAEQLQLAPCPDSSWIALPLAYNPIPQIAAPRKKMRTLITVRQAFFQFLKYWPLFRNSQKTPLRPYVNLRKTQCQILNPSIRRMILRIRLTKMQRELRSAPADPRKQECSRL